jgi:hypothetical protein
VAEQGPDKLVERETGNGDLHAGEDGEYTPIIVAPERRPAADPDPGDLVELGSCCGTPLARSA